MQKKWWLLENHHLLTIIVMFNLVKKHQRMLNSSGWEIDEERDTYIVSKYLLTRYLLITKRLYNNFTVETPGRQQHNKWIKVKNTNNQGLLWWSSG